MDFEKRLREVESLMGSESAMDAFNASYESLLLAVNRVPKAKHEKLERMRRLLHRQFLYLYAQWKRARIVEGVSESTTFEGMN